MTNCARHLILLCLALLAGAAPARAAEIAVGDLSASFTPFGGTMPTTGLSVSYRGIPVLTRSVLNVVSPDWSKTLLTLGRAQGKLAASDVPGGKRLAFTATSDSFSLAYTIDVLEGNRVVIDTHGALLKDEPAIAEYGAGFIAAALLAGQPFRAATIEGERAGTMPFRAGTLVKGPEDALVVPPAMRVQVESLAGALSIEAGPGDMPLDLWDARRVASQSVQDYPVFWLGYLKVPLEMGRPFHSRVTLRIVPPPASARPERPAGEAQSLPIEEIPAARVQSPPDGAIIPAPKEMHAGRGAFAIDAGTRIVFGTDPAGRRAARELQERIQEDFGVAVPTAPASVWHDRRNVIVVGSIQNSTVRRWLSETGLSPVTHPEGYALQVTPQHVLLAGADARGTLYGAFTLAQMLSPEYGSMGVWECGGAGVAGGRPVAHTPIPPHPRTPTLTLRASTTRDWPTLPIRAVHLLTDHWSAFLHRDLIRRVLAPHKINTILLECEYVQWDSHPELHVPWGMPKEDVRAILSLARDYDIEVIPLVQALGHVGWMFENGQHLDLAEDPATRYAYCPSNPKTYALLFDVMGEAIELFGHPRFVHIGHDEFTHRGKFGEHAPCRGKSIDDLFVADTLKIRDFLAKRGARTMMWGDMILGPGEAKDAVHAATVGEARSLRERLPKDILIADWHYAPAEAYPSVKILRDAGFEVWAATWYQPENIAGFARAAAEAATGLVQTTWTGYYGNMTALRNWLPQLSAYILAADEAWSPGGRPLAEASELASRRFSEVWPGLPHAAGPRAGFTIDLEPLANAPWTDTARRDGWLGYGPEHDLSALPGGVQRLGGQAFRLPEGRKAVALAGPLMPARYPASVRVPVGRRASQIVLLMTAGWEVSEGRRVGRVIVHYADGTRMEVELLYGWNIRAVNDDRAAFLAPAAWRGRAAGGEPLTLRAFTLGNPLPRKEIASVEVTSDGTESGVILFAVSGEETSGG